MHKWKSRVVFASIAGMLSAASVAFGRTSMADIVQRADAKSSDAWNDRRVVIEFSISVFTTGERSLPISQLFAWDQHGRLCAGFDVASVRSLALADVG
jgi:hypothetical protein